MRETQNQPGASIPTARGAARPLPGARMALLLLLSINLFNYIDRQILSAVEPDIRRHLLLNADPNDPHTKVKMGLLALAFMLTYMTMAPVFGILAERRSRWTLVALGVALWSLASGASGLAGTFVILLITRCLVGVGEAAYGPIAPTIISDLYPVESRGRVLSWFYLAIPIGSALGYAIGGQFAALDPALQSWRWAFYAVVPPGLLLGWWALRMRAPRRGAADVVVATSRPKMKDYLQLLRNRSYVRNTIGMTAMTFAIGGVAFWTPEYLQMHHVQPLWGIEARTAFGILTALAGLIATLAGGIAGDRLHQRWSGSYFIVSGLALIIAAPCFLLFLGMSFPAAWIGLFLVVFLLFFNIGPTNTILANVTHPSIRATAFAVNIFIIHALGDAISPLIIGAIADRSSLAVGFALTSVFMVLGGAVWLIGARHLAADTAAATNERGPGDSGPEVAPH